MRAYVLAICIAIVFVPGSGGPFIQDAVAGCITESGRCKGCGCKGGPGYRSLRTGQCVSHKGLYYECGNPPTRCCVYEGAPGTGANAACALENVDIDVLKRKAMESGHCRK